MAKAKAPTAKQKAARAKFTKNVKEVSKLVSKGMSRKAAWKKVK